MGQETEPNPLALQAIWVVTLIGLLLSSIACGLVIYIYFQNRNQKSLSLKILAYTNTYGLIYSLSWAMNLTVGLFLFGDIGEESNNEQKNTHQLDIMCYIINPLKIFCNFQWFAWNGFILFLLQQGIKNTFRIDLKKLRHFIDRVFHPLVSLVSLTVALLPFYNLQSYSTVNNQAYVKYICQYHHYNDKTFSQVLYFIVFLLPMWLLVFYTIYIYVDIYRTYTKLKLGMPTNFWRMMYQPIVISITWIWPTIGFLMRLFNVDRYFFMKAIFIVTQGFTICLQSMMYLNQIQKTQNLVLCLDDRNENKLIIRKVIVKTKIDKQPRTKIFNASKHSDESSTQKDTSDGS